MAKTEETPQEETPSEAVDTHVEMHLDRDPNDPRNVPPASKLPSLNDPNQQGPDHGRLSNDNDQSELGQDFVK